MKIDQTNAMSQVEAPRTVAPRVQAEKAEARATDQVAISKQAQDLRKLAFAAAPELKGATASRMAEIKESMRRGGFHADAGAIADKLMSEIEA